MLVVDGLVMVSSRSVLAPAVSLVVSVRSTQTSVLPAPLLWSSQAPASTPAYIANGSETPTHPVSVPYVAPLTTMPVGKVHAPSGLVQNSKMIPCTSTVVGNVKPKLYVTPVALACDVDIVTLRLVSWAASTWPAYINGTKLEATKTAAAIMVEKRLVCLRMASAVNKCSMLILLLFVLTVTLRVIT